MIDHKIEYYDNGKIKSEEYYLNGLLHNNKGPAYITYYNNSNSKVYSEIYYIDGELHNSEGSAYIEYYDNGNKKYEIYRVNGKLHNYNGPAVINYYYNETIKSEEYYIQNYKLSKDQYEYISEFQDEDKLNAIMLLY